MSHNALAFFLAILLFSIGGCFSQSAAGGANDVRELTGSIQWNPIEGGFYVIRADDGTVYDPMSLPAEFKKDGLKVVAKVKVRTDARSIRMVGTIVEIVSIEKR